MLCCALVDNHGCCALVHMLLRIGSHAVAHWFTCCCASVGHMLLRSGEALLQVAPAAAGESYAKPAKASTPLTKPAAAPNERTCWSDDDNNEEEVDVVAICDERGGIHVYRDEVPPE